MAGHELLDGLPLDELGDDVGSRRSVAAVVEDLHDIIVMQLSDRLRFPLQPGLGFSLRQQVRVQDLDRYLTLERLIVGLVDDCHAALADFFDDAIPRGEPSLQHENRADLCGGAGARKDPIISTFQTRFHSSMSGFFPPKTTLPSQATP
jgi:hypothetical protein